MKTYSPKKDDIKRKWYIIDATDQILGRIAAPVAAILRGKNKATFSPHLDCGDHVIVINAAKVKVTGNKLDDKLYYSHSGYPGALKEVPLRRVMEKNPCKVIEHAVAGMIPRNRLKSHVIGKLKIYADENHPHEAQLPEQLKIAN